MLPVSFQAIRATPSCGPTSLRRAGVALLLSLVGLLAAGCSSLVPANSRSDWRSGEEVEVTLKNKEVEAAAIPALLIPVATEALNYAIKWIGSELKAESERYVAEYTGTGSGKNFYTTGGKVNLDTIKVERFLPNGSEKKVATELVMKVESSADGFRLVADKVKVDYAKAKVSDGRWYLPWTWFTSHQNTIDLDVEVTFEALWTEDGRSHNEALSVVKLPIRNITLGDGNSKTSAVSAWIPWIPRTSQSTKANGAVGAGGANGGGTTVNTLGRGTYNVKVLVREFDDFGERVKMLSDKIEGNREEWVKKLEEYLKK